MNCRRHFIFALACSSLFILQARSADQPRPASPAKRTGAQQKSFASFIDLPSRYVIGGHADGRWLKSDAAGKRLTAPATDYRTFSLVDEVAKVTAGKAAPDEELCPDVWLQKITPEVDPEAKLIGVNAPWNPMPRKAQLADVTQELYVNAVRELLNSKGISKPKVKIRQVLRVDLEGDGKEETLIAAAHYTNEAELTSAVAGDYSFVALCRVVDGKTRTQFVTGEVYPKADTNGALNSFEIGGLLDLDGDGCLDVIVHTSYYEGGGTQVWRLTNGKLVRVLSVECGV